MQSCSGRTLEPESECEVIDTGSALRCGALLQGRTLLDVQVVRVDHQVHLQAVGRVASSHEVVHGHLWSHSNVGALKRWRGSSGYTCTECAAVAHQRLAAAQLHNAGSICCVAACVCAAVTYRLVVLVEEDSLTRHGGPQHQLCRDEHSRIVVGSRDTGG